VRSRAAPAISLRQSRKNPEAHRLAALHTLAQFVSFLLRSPELVLTASPFTCLMFGLFNNPVENDERDTRRPQNELKQGCREIMRQ